MSYRQVNNWDAQGALPNQREQEAAWRKFSLREIFTIMVCKEIRGRFGTSLESLRSVRKFMLQDSADHLGAAIEMMQRGSGVFLLTDLRKTFILKSGSAIEDYFHNGFLREGGKQAYMLIRLNHLVKHLLECLEKPIAPRNRLYEYCEPVRHARQRINEEPSRPPFHKQKLSGGRR